MPDKEQIRALFEAAKKAWQLNDDDQRKEFVFTVDFIYRTSQSYIGQLKLNNHFLKTLRNDPLIQKDTRDYIQVLIEDNDKLLGIKEKEVANG